MPFQRKDLAFEVWKSDLCLTLHKVRLLGYGISLTQPVPSCGGCRSTVPAAAGFEGRLKFLRATDCQSPQEHCGLAMMECAMTVKQASELAREIEERLCDVLGIPAEFRIVVREKSSGGDEAPARWRTHPSEGDKSLGMASPALEHLRGALSELEYRASRIGQVPVGYPRHLNLIMRCISALLPWYTRSLRDFSCASVDTCRLLARQLEEVERERRDIWRILSDLGGNGRPERTASESTLPSDTGLRP